MGSTNRNIRLIYIIGNSHTGSTILSLYLDSHPFINYVGEIKKLDQSFKDRFCTCGEDAERCPFWGPFIVRHQEYFNKPAKSNNGFYRFFSTYKSILTQSSKEEIEYERSFLDDLVIRCLKFNEGTEFIMDSSKSLKRFITLSKMKGIEIYPIFIDRDLRSNLASFVKRGKGLLRSYLRLRINRYLILNHLNKNEIAHVKVNYERFVKHPDETRKNVWNFVGLSEEGFEDVPIIGTHQITGNRKTLLQFPENQAIIKLNEKEPFSPIQKILLRILGL